jgi:hypothetical protein
MTYEEVRKVTLIIAISIQEQVLDILAQELPKVEMERANLYSLMHTLIGGHISALINTLFFIAKQDDGIQKRVIKFKDDLIVKLIEGSEIFRRPEKTH